MKKICIFISILFLLPMLMNCKGRITGEVKKSIARAAVEESPYLESVLVSLSVSSYDTAGLSGLPDDVYTNQAGYYVFEGLKAGMYNVTFTAINYGSVTATIPNVKVEANITTEISPRILLPTSLTPEIAISGAGYSVDAGVTNSITCDIFANVINSGDSPVYGIEVTGIVRTAGGAEIVRGYGGATPDPVIPDPNSPSSVTIEGLACGSSTPGSVVWSVTYSTTATPTYWSIDSK